MPPTVSFSASINTLQQFRKQGLISILVNFDIPDYILQERIATSQRPKTIFRTASGFEEVLSRQQAETDKGDVISPTEDEADYLFVIKDSNEVQSVIRKIVDIAQSVSDVEFYPLA